MEKGKNVTITVDAHNVMTNHIDQSQQKIGGFVSAAIIEKVQRERTQENPVLERNIKKEE